ncbi:DUF475 domain-containing protein [Candidatus Saccharibacteria bacterium]|nr:DUF475 domain-containing protein [Candidatus Saccharibacteria bacterium]
MHSLFKIYWFSIVATAVIWLTVGWQLGLAALFTVLVLTLLEVTFSADNAVVNSRVLVTMSPFWQKMFLTLGIFIAVFVVRFAAPLLIVMITAGLSLPDVIHFLFADPEGYSYHLHAAEPVINAFGGTFLLMIALSFFIDDSKSLHWLRPIERRLARLGQFHNFTLYFMLIGVAAIYFTVGPEHHMAVFVAAVLAIVLYVGLNLLGTKLGKNRSEDERSGRYAKKKNGKNPRTSAAKSTAAKPSPKSSLVKKTGMAAFSAFLYLEVLDASFSIDGVVGAFAITSDVILIMAGLGAGAFWVRSITIHLVRRRILSKIRFLEHGAHWAIAFLGGVMMARLYGAHLPEWFVGSLGLVFIGLAVWWSYLMSRREKA